MLSTKSLHVISILSYNTVGMIPVLYDPYNTRIHTCRPILMFYTGNGIERVMKVLKQTAAREEDFVFSSLCESCDYQLAILEQAQIIQSFVERVSQEAYDEWTTGTEIFFVHQRMLVKGLRQHGYCRNIHIGFRIGFPEKQLFRITSTLNAGSYAVYDCTFLNDIWIILLLDQSDKCIVLYLSHHYFLCAPRHPQTSVHNMRYDVIVNWLAVYMLWITIIIIKIITDDPFRCTCIFRSSTKEEWEESNRKVQGMIIDLFVLWYINSKW